MSTFNGQFNAVPGISADRFDGAINRQSSVFFLSHCHTDHMVGLDHADGVPGPLYLSRVSALIVRHLFPVDKVAAKCVVLEVGQPTLISYTTKESALLHRLTVTAIPAGHCPGSVMFIFELGNTRVLYTGDFRLSLDNLSRLNVFRDAPRFDVAHIDSTFFSPAYTHFPSQRESAQAVGQLITEWLVQHPRNQIVLQMSARYGYEYLFIYLHQCLQLAVHVNATEADTWRYVPEMDGCFTGNGDASTTTRVHACWRAAEAGGDGGVRSCRRTRTVPCDASVEEKWIRVIKPSAMVWTGLAAKDAIWRRDGDEFYRVCYSNHSSWTEIKDMLCHVQPKEVRLNVLPLHGPSRSAMVAELQRVMAEYQDEAELVEGTTEQTELGFVKFKLSANQAVKRIDVATEDSDEEPLEIVNLVKRRRK